jgi:hypothetical protein
VSRAVHIVALGARTPVGLNAAATAAAVRAGICRIGSHPVFVDRMGDSVMMGLDQELSPRMLGVPRLVRMASAALEEVRQPIADAMAVRPQATNIDVGTGGTMSDDAALGGGGSGGRGGAGGSGGHTSTGSGGSAGKGGAGTGGLGKGDAWPLGAYGDDPRHPHDEHGPGDLRHAKWGIPTRVRRLPSRWRYSSGNGNDITGNGQGPAQDHGGAPRQLRTRCARAHASLPSSSCLC